MFGMFVSGVLNPNVVHNKSEDDWLPLVLPKAKCGGALVIAMAKESLGEEVIGQFSHLLEP